MEPLRNSHRKLLGPPRAIVRGGPEHMRKRVIGILVLEEHRFQQAPTELDLGLEPRSGPRGRNDQAARAISIGQLNALQRLHLRPINVVVFDGSSGGCPREAYSRGSLPA